MKFIKSFGLTQKEHRYGVLMVGAVTILWGLLPILLKLASEVFSPIFISWVRLAIGSFFLVCFLRRKRMLTVRPIRYPPSIPIIAGILLAVNYYSYIKGVALTSPSQASVLIQTGPLVMTLFGLFLFKERFNHLQYIGLLIASLGFFAFHSERLNHAPLGTDNNLGNAFTIASALSFAIYSAAQKKLAQRLNLQIFNLIMFIIAFLIFSIFVDISEFAHLTLFSGTVLLSLGLITVFGYMGLSEAISVIPISVVSVIVAVYPVFTLLIMKLLEDLDVTWIKAENISLFGYASALSAIIGVALVVSSRKISRQLPRTDIDKGEIVC